ncbi:PREDICTED: uncharacterized protein LOC108557452 [Nicrophorus vespilloides]|uniref:Uncharacterized protein LOC108557452 n=1 Tax=Nicrophorus vespilloides TaxID=110193 RepID=A0ABM1M4E8_NICVS|nr:PREDICTED: uncharacterized protein LOC108557452 [Nicrophorus vespilloides]
MRLQTKLIGSLALIGSISFALRFDALKTSSNIGYGKDNKDGYHLEMGHESSKGHSKESYKDKGRKGEDLKGVLKGFHDEDGGNSKRYHNGKDQFQKHFKGRQSHKGGKFGERKGHKKGHKTKGYHNKFYKDEYIKEHKFYDDYHKSGEYSKYGDRQSGFKAGDGDGKKGHGYKKSEDSSKFGNKGNSDHGHRIIEDSGYDVNEGKEKKHEHYNEGGKKGETRKGNRYLYSS